MTSIAQSIPADVVQEIFKTLSSPLLVRTSGNAHEFPWSLGHTCSLWRAVFLSMRREFWSKFILYPAHSSSPENEQRCATIAEEFLQRNNGMPFSFEMHHHSRPVLDLLMAESARWQSVWITIGEHDIPALISVKGHLPLLCSLSLSIPRNPDLISQDPDYASEETHLPWDYRDIFKNAPRLTHVTLPDISVWEFDWASIIVLELIKPVRNSMLQLGLPLMVNLERLLLNQPSIYRTIYIEGVMFTLPRLKVLSLSGYNILPILKTPSLEQLYINVIHGTHSWDRIVPSFFQRSSCQLQRFGLGACTLEALAFGLRDTPEIKYLSVLPLHGSAEVFKLLTCSPGGYSVSEMQSLRMIFPNLREELFLPALTAMVASRTGKHSLPVSQFKELILVLSSVDDFGPTLLEVEEVCKNRDVLLRIEIERRETDWDWELHRLSGGS